MTVDYRELPRPEQLRRRAEAVTRSEQAISQRRSELYNGSNYPALPSDNLEVFQHILEKRFGWAPKARNEIRFICVFIALISGAAVCGYEVVLHTKSDLALERSVDDLNRFVDIFEIFVKKMGKSDAGGSAEAAQTQPNPVQAQPAGPPIVLNNSSGAAPALNTGTTPEDYDNSGLRYRRANNFGLAQTAFLKAWSGGHTPAAAHLGFMYDRGDLPGGVPTMIVWYAKGASVGDPAAEYRLALAYKTGRGEPKNSRQACQYLGLARKTLMLARQEYLAEHCDLDGLI